MKILSYNSVKLWIKTDNYLISNLLKKIDFTCAVLFFLFTLMLISYTQYSIEQHNVLSFVVDGWLMAKQQVEISTGHRSFFDVIFSPGNHKILIPRILNILDIIIFDGGNFIYRNSIRLLTFVALILISNLIIKDGINTTWKMSFLFLQAVIVLTMPTYVYSSVYFFYSRIHVF